MKKFMKEEEISVSKRGKAMGMNETPSGERTQIGIFGRTNAGKSSLINAITNQSLAIVSDVKGTTTDPVKKAMELLPLGPVVLIDTPGLDDEGELGQQRVEKSRQMLRQSDIVILVLSYGEIPGSLEQDLIKKAKGENRPYLVVVNKSDVANTEEIKADEAREIYGKSVEEILFVPKEKICFVSAVTGEGIAQLKDTIAGLIPTDEERPLVRDLINPGDFVVLVVPIDSAAPKGRLILPQQQVIRDVLEGGTIPVVCRETELKEALAGLGKPPRLVITDSQAFGQVSKVTPKEIPLTSFSILMARYKGDLKTQINGARAVENLKDGDKVLISEGCTHHRQCGDIGTQKLPKWITEHCGKKLEFHFTSGTEFPEDLSEYALVVHCGGCTLPVKEMRYRISHGAKENVPITNYGVMIAYVHGILPRVIQPFGEI